MSNLAPFDGDQDAYLSWIACIAAIRERKIRAGELEPRTDTEERWAREGPVAAHLLESWR